MIAALAAAGWVCFKYRSGEKGIKEPVKLDLPEATQSYAPTQDDPYFALYGKYPLETDDPTPEPTKAPTPVSTQMTAKTPTPAPSWEPTPETSTLITDGTAQEAPQRTVAHEMETIPPEITHTPTPTPTPRPTPTPIPSVDLAFTFAEEVTYAGDLYRYNDNVVSLLFMGIDDPDTVTVRTEGFGKGNQTDVILLVAIDADRKKVTLLHISRDTMTKVNILSYDHQTIVGNRVMQIALSHAYGDGADLSCLLATDAASALIGTLPINGYASLNYGALSILNDTVGGVTVTLDADMTISGVAYKSGDVVSLEGDMAADYIRNRSTGEGTNSERMGRQEGYIKGFIGRCLSSGRNPAKLVMDLYNATRDYVVTNLTEDEIVYLGATVLSSGWTVEIESVPGELKLDDIYEFYPDEDALSQMLVNIFYTKD